MALCVWFVNVHIFSKSASLCFSALEMQGKIQVRMTCNGKCSAEHSREEMVEGSV